MLLMIKREVLIIKINVKFEITHTVFPWIVAPAIINFEGNFARKYFVNFWEYKYFWESITLVDL